MAMNIQLHVVDNNNNVLETKVLDFSFDLFNFLAKSEFSALGQARKANVVIDGEIVEMKLVLLSPVVRRSLSGFLSRCLVDLLKTSLDKMGDSPSRDEYQDYTRDLKEFVELIQCIEKEKYTHLDRG